MGDVDGGFVSGELLLRSDADNARSLPAKLEERLRSSLSGRAWYPAARYQPNAKSAKSS